MFPNASPLIYILHSIKFQKRGLPYAHILVKYASLCIVPSDIDQVILAYIPDDETDANTIQKFMMHSAHPTTVINAQPLNAAHPL
jgi:hypothetical protein